MTDTRLLKPCPNSPNCVSSLAEDSGHAIAPLAYSDSPESAWERLKLVLQSVPRTTIVEESENYLRAEVVSRWCRFVDDVECVLDPDVEVIHVRSASRLGYSDFGVNRKRIEALREQFSR